MPDANKIHFIKLPDEDFVRPIEDTTARVDIFNLDGKVSRDEVKYMGLYAAQYSSGEYDPDTHLPASMPIYLNLSINGDAAFYDTYNAVSIQVAFFDNALNYAEFADTVISLAAAHGSGYTDYPVYDQINGSRLKLKDVYAKTVSFVYIKTRSCFYMVGVPVSVSAVSVSYDNSLRGLLATNVQDAIDEIIDELAPVATSGDYDDLTNKPTIPTVNDATLTIQKNGSIVDTFSANASVNKTVNITVPTTVAELSDSSDYAQTADLASVAISGDYDDLTNKPDLSDLPFIENVTHADDFDSGTGYTHNNIVKYNDKMYRCTLPSGTSQSGSFDPAIWEEVTVGGLSDDIEQVSDDVNNLAAVARSGSYSDLSGTPTIPTLTSQLVNDTGFLTSSDVASVAMSGDYSDLNGTPTLATVATSGNYSDLNGAPTLATVATSGDYDDLTDKPTFKTINGDAITGTGNIATASKTDSTASATSSTSGTWATRASVNITPGLWLLVANCYWSSNVNGYRYSTIAPNAASETGGVGYMRTSATNGQVTNHSLAAVVSESTNKTYYLNMLQNSGSPLTIGGNFTAVKLA